jgi:putative endonuclease
MDFAIAREKRSKEWKQKWKVQLVEKTKPDWEDLYPGII